MKELNVLVQQPKGKKMATGKSTKPKFFTADDIRGYTISVHANFKKGTLVWDKKKQYQDQGSVVLVVDWRDKYVLVTVRGNGFTEAEGHEWSMAFNDVYVNQYAGTPGGNELGYSASEIQDFVLDVAREVSFLLASIHDDSDVSGDIKDLIKRALAPAAFTAYMNDKSEAVAIQKEARKKIAAPIRLFKATRCA